VAWDAPGFGKSGEPARGESIAVYTKALNDLLDALKFEDAVILGHSLGGIVAQEFYRDYPARVRTLILADTTQGGGDPTNRLRMIRSMTPQELARERAPKLLSKNAPRELIEEAVAIMSEVRPAGYEFAAIAMSKADTRGLLDCMRVPLLMIWGAEDTITPPWVKWPEGARVEIIPNAGHLCYIEGAETFNKVVLDFLIP
jgi:pimeloyl-ACP methyl ester carboxylesterase